MNNAYSAWMTAGTYGNLDDTYRLCDVNRWPTLF